MSNPSAPRLSEFSKGNAWKKPKAIPMPSMESLGRFSDDEGSVILDEDEVTLIVEKFSTALVGRMFGKKIPYLALVGRMFGEKIPYLQLLTELKRRWEAFGAFHLITHSGDYFLCVFYCAEACEAVLMGGPWVLFGQVLGVDRWISSFSPSSLEGFKTPIWACMLGLPLYCWSSMNIARMCASIGEPLWLDSATAQIERGLFARACIRLDLSKPLKPGFWVTGHHGRFFQLLEYEGLSLFCFRYRQVGHKEFSCKMQAPVKVDEIFIQSIKDIGLYDLIWQAFVVFFSIHSVGVQGDQRTHANVVYLRAIIREDGMIWQAFILVLFSSEMIGIGMGRIRKESQLQAAENALHNLAKLSCVQGAAFSWKSKECKQSAKAPKHWTVSIQCRRSRHYRSRMAD